VPDYPDYEVSEYGHLRRLTKSKTYPKGHVSRPYIDRDGYVRYTIRPSVCVKSSPRAAHRLVATAFLGGPPSAEKFQINHVDGNRANNHWRNLRWGEPSDNSADMRAHGTILRRYGSANPIAKLNEVKVAAIRRKYATGKYTLAELGAEYGVCFQSISLIVNRKIWRHEAA